MTHTFNVSLLPTCIDIFFSKHPSVRVTVQELNAESVGRGVEGGEFDIGIAYRPNSAAAISFEPLCNDEMALVVSPAHPLASRKRIRMVELHRQNLVLSTSDTTTRELLEGWFRSVGAEPVIVVEMNPIASALALVRRMNIGAIISRQALIEVKDLCIIPIENPTPMRTPGILWNRDRQPTAAAKSFAVILRNAVTGHADGVARPPQRQRSAFRRHDGQDHEIIAVGGEVKRGLAAVDRRRAVLRIVMQERTAAGELVLHVG